MPGQGVVARALTMTLVFLGVLGASCNFGSSMPADPSSLTSVTPAAPSPPATAPTETFSGSLALAGTDFHFFTATQAGVIDVTLPSLGPSVKIVLLGLGVPNADGSGCNLSKFPSLLANVSAGPGLALPAASQSAGAYCVGIEDVFMEGPLTYTIQVWHT